MPANPRLTHAAAAVANELAYASDEGVVGRATPAASADLPDGAGGIARTAVVGIVVQVLAAAVAVAVLLAADAAAAAVAAPGAVPAAAAVAVASTFVPQATAVGRALVFAPQPEQTTEGTDQEPEASTARAASCEGTGDAVKVAEIQGAP